MELQADSLSSVIKGDVLIDSYSLGMYATDASVYQITPKLVVLPKDQADVQAAVGWAAKNKISILPRGGGTSLAGQTVGAAMVLDFSKYMNQLLELNLEEKWVRVQPGLVCDELNHLLKEHGLQFAPDPATSSRANVGGMVGNNSSGTKSIIYGKTMDHVLEAKVLLSDGTLLNFSELRSNNPENISFDNEREQELYGKFQNIIAQNDEEIRKRFPKVMRRVGGYNFDAFIDDDHWNLCKIITGSEGTLAVTLELKLNLVPLPACKSVCVVHFATIPEAIGAVETILEYNPAAVEILDKTVLDLSRENLTTKRSCHFLEGDPEAVLIVEFYGDTDQDVDRRPKEMISRLHGEGVGFAYPLFPQGDAYNDVWLIRKKGLGLMLGLKGEKTPLAFIEDAGIPINVLPEYIDKALAVCKKHKTEVAMYAHASVGVIHLRPILDLRQEKDIERFKSISEEVFQLVQEYGGSWSGEHGDGLVRSEYNQRFFGDQLYQAFKQVKELFDPGYLMNPGKIVEAPPMDQNLRYGTAYQDQKVATQFHYDKDESFEAAVHMCTGVGECRKILGGTMCPSFKATRDEEHSTRGRANALRLAMSGQLNGEGLGSARLQEVMDLCLSCKACKSECPSNVDLAKLKSEVRQQYFDTHGVPRRDAMVKNSAKMAAKFSGGLSGVFNFIQSNPLTKSLLDSFVGIDARRDLPKLSKEPFHKWYNTNHSPTNNDLPEVVLFADTYMNYYEPQVGKSAYRLLTGLGYEVLLAQVGCCQRPKISNGFLKEAKKEGAQMASQLDVYLKQDLPVVVCEPSCASALNDDLPDLLDDREVAKRLQQVQTIERFIAQEHQAGKVQLHFEAPLKNEILIHGHCHQKALYGTADLKLILSQIPEASVNEIDSGCCGMAGSFGYEKEHYDLSQKIGEQVLFPAVTQAPEATLVACGFSCRHQIEHFTGRNARHWVEVVKLVN